MFLSLVSLVHRYTRLRKNDDLPLRLVASSGDKEKKLPSVLNVHVYSLVKVFLKFSL